MNKFPEARLHQYKSVKVGSSLLSRRSWTTDRGTLCICAQTQVGWPVTVLRVPLPGRWPCSGCGTAAM